MEYYIKFEQTDDFNVCISLMDVKTLKSVPIQIPFSKDKNAYILNITNNDLVYYITEATRILDEVRRYEEN